MDIRKRYPLSISMIVCCTAPALNIRDAPSVRLTTPEVIAASWSARSAGRSRDEARSRPSAETATTCAIPATLSAKLLSSQPMSCMVGGLVTVSSPSEQGRPRQLLHCRPYAHVAHRGGTRRGGHVPHPG